MLTDKSKHYLNKGKNVALGFNRTPGGQRFAVEYNKKYYLINDDGTENGFYDSGDPEEISAKNFMQELFTRLPEETALEECKRFDFEYDLEKF